MSDVFWSHQAKNNMSQALLLLRQNKLAAYWYDDDCIRYFVHFSPEQIIRNDEVYIYTYDNYKFNRKWFWHLDEVHPKRGCNEFRVVPYNGQRIGKK